MPVAHAPHQHVRLVQDLAAGADLDRAQVAQHLLGVTQQRHDGEAAAVLGAHVEGHLVGDHVLRVDAAADGHEQLPGQLAPVAHRELHQMARPLARRQAVVRHPQLAAGAVLFGLRPVGLVQGLQLLQDGAETLHLDRVVAVAHRREALRVDGAIGLEEGLGLDGGGHLRRDDLAQVLGHGHAEAVDGIGHAGSCGHTSVRGSGWLVRSRSAWR